MKTLKITQTYVEETQVNIRYCPHCKAKVRFKDSGKRRQNANGKNIHHYIIYKCDKGHTWNKKTEQIKAYSGLKNKYDDKAYNKSGAIMPLTSYLNGDYTQIEIKMIIPSQSIRLDKLMTKMLMGISRSDIVLFIEKGIILHNGTIVKKNKKVSEGDIISVMVYKMTECDTD